jgi:hypothetical protein
MRHKGSIAHFYTAAKECMALFRNEASEWIPEDVKALFDEFKLAGIWGGFPEYSISGGPIRRE